MPEHECVFVEEQEPSGRLVLPPCIVCGCAAMDALAQIRAALASLLRHTPDGGGYPDRYHVCETGCTQLGACPRHKAIYNAQEILDGE